MKLPPPRRRWSACSRLSARAGSRSRRARLGPSALDLTLEGGAPAQVRDLALAGLQGIPADLSVQHLAGRRKRLLIGATLLLASDAAGSFITGEELIVDGGYHAMSI